MTGPGFHAGRVGGRGAAALRSAAALLLLAAALLSGSAAAEPPAGRAMLAEALVADGEAAQFPVDRVSRTQALPERWDDPDATSPAARWYRMRFDRPAGADPDALLGAAFDRLCGRWRLLLNGRVVHEPPAARREGALPCQRPLVVALPPALLRERANLLDLRLEGLPLARVASREAAAGLSAVEIGPYAELAAERAVARWWRVDAVQAVNLVLATLALLLLALAAMRRRDPTPYVVGIAALLWALLSARVWAGRLPLPAEAVEFLAVPLLAVVLGLAVQFLLAYAGLRSRAIEAALVVQALVVPLSQWLAGPAQTFRLAGAWTALLVLELAAAVALFLRTAARQQRGDLPLLAALLGTLVALPAAELAVQRGWLPPPDVSLLHLLVPLALIVLLLGLMRAFVRTVHSIEADRAALEQRVREAAGEIERKYQQLAELRVEQVTLRERKRIAADLHDDLGAKLLTIVHTSESERISTLAREALEEMRLSVRGLTGRPMKLHDALADWRAEVVQRLGQANIEIDWRGPADEETDVELPARSYVQTTRIVREAVSNIIKHSGASHCKVRCAVTADAFGINIQDNGRGIPMELDGKLDRGHGMSSMKGRAKQMQGQCLVESGPGYGTVIRLTLPLRPTA